MEVGEDGVATIPTLSAFHFFIIIIAPSFVTRINIFFFLFVILIFHAWLLEILLCIFFRKFKMIAKYERGVILTFLTTQNIKLASDQTPRTSFPSYVKPPRPTLHASKAPSSLPSILWPSFPSFVRPSPT